MDVDCAQQRPSAVAIGKRPELSNERSRPSLLVYVPSDLVKQARKRRQRDTEIDSAPLIGWSIPASCSDDVAVIVVAGLAPYGARTVSKEVASRFSVHGHEPGLIGSLIASQKGRGSPHTRLNGSSSPSETLAKSSLSNLTLQAETGRIRIASLVHNLAPSARECAVHLVEYTTPDPGQMRFFSLEGMILPPASLGGNEIKERTACSQSHLRAKLEQLVRLDPVRFQDLGRRYPSGEAPGQRLRLSINLLNSCHYLIEAMERRQLDDSRGPKGEDSSRSSTHQALPIAFGLVSFPLRLFRSSLRAQILGRSLVESSFAVQQLDLRCSELLAWPSLGKHLRSRRLKEQASIADIAPVYTSLYNGIWLVGNDLILGQAIGAWLLDNHERIAMTIAPHLQLWLSDHPVRALAWLDSWPAGIKLNSQLSRFFCDVYTIIAKVCGDAMVNALTANENANLVRTLYGISFATQSLGLSMFLSLLCDVIGAVAVPLTMCYNAQRSIFVFFCSSLRSLFHLFRGKKRNPLRKMRVDDADYELDQLLLGTLFFTLFVFLWLTVAVYYAYFATVRFGIITLIALLQTAITMLNHLPLFALMLRIKDARRLPGGIALRRRNENSPAGKNASSDLASTHIVLENVPLTVSDIFRGYYSHLDGLKCLPSRMWDAVQGRQI